MPAMLGALQRQSTSHDGLLQKTLYLNPLPLPFWLRSGKRRASCLGSGRRIFSTDRGSAISCSGVDFVPEYIAKEAQRPSRRTWRSVVLAAQGLDDRATGTRRLACQ